MYISITDDYAYWGRSAADEATLKAHIESKYFLWRDNSVLVDYWLDNYPSTYSVYKPNYFEGRYKQFPTVLEVEHYANVKNDGNWSGTNGSTKGAAQLKGAIGLMHATYVGFHGYADEWLRENPDLAKSLGNYMGYWFLPRQLRLTALKRGQLATMDMTWANKGVAPAYYKYKVHLKLVLNTNANTQYNFDLSGTFDPTKWLTGDTKQSATFTPPASMPTGTYKVQLFLQRYVSSTDITNVDLGLKSTADVGGKVFQIGSVSVQ